MRLTLNCYLTSRNQVRQPDDDPLSGGGSMRRTNETLERPAAASTEPRSHLDGRAAPGAEPCGSGGLRDGPRGRDGSGGHRYIDRSLSWIPGDCHDAPYQAEEEP